MYPSLLIPKDYREDRSPVPSLIAMKWSADDATGRRGFCTKHNLSHITTLGAV